MDRGPPGIHEMLGGDAPGAVAVFFLEAVEPVESLVLGRGTSDCRYEHEPQIRFSPRSLPGGRISSTVGKEQAVDQIYERVAGLDVHRDNVVACFRRLGPRGGVVFEKDRFATTTAGLRVLEAWLAERQVQLVAMEATGVYWKPVYYALEARFTLWLCNARNVKKVPGRKTDMSDAEWLADVAAHGMVRPSFVPPAPIRELRELTRYRKTQIDARASVRGPALGEGPPGRGDQAVLGRLKGPDPVRARDGRGTDRWRARRREAGRAGERQDAPQDPRAGRGADGRLTGRFGAHHAVACERILGHLDFLNASIAALTEQIDARTAAFEPVYALLLPVPGVDRLTVDVIIAETGADMARFPTAGDLASWVGLCPGSYESAGKRRRSAPPAATSGCAARCSSPAGPRHAPSTATSARNTGRSLAAADRTRRPSPSRTR